MKPREIRDMTADEIERKIKEFKDNLFKLKVKMQTKQLEDTSGIGAIKKDLARLNTILREKKGADKEGAVNGGKK